MNEPPLRFSAALLGLALATTGGCQPGEQVRGGKNGHGHSHDHAHSDVPRSLHGAVGELRRMWGDIAVAMDDGDPDAAHAPLHDVGNLLEAIPDLAAETDLPESEWNEINSKVDELFDAFGDMDSAFHKQDGDKVAAYEAAKSTIDDGVAVLEAKLPLLETRASDDVRQDEDRDTDDDRVEADRAHVHGHDVKRPNDP